VRLAAKSFKASHLLISVLFLSALMYCSEKPEKSATGKEAVTILIQPFKGIESEKVEFVAKEIGNVKILEPVDFPENTYYSPRNRYRADSLISFLGKNTKEGFITIGLTSKDISATKGKVKDFGIMGLGFRPGNACIASSFRLDDENLDEQFFKVAVHELGHTQGLKHCPMRTCFMRSAEGKNPTNEETGFCKKCKQVLMNNNWKFSSI